MRDLAFFTLGFFTATAILSWLVWKAPDWANEAIQHEAEEARKWEEDHG